MAGVKKFRTLKEAILLVQQEAKHASLSIGEILHILSGKGRPLILILLSMPFCQPIQIPGLSTPFGIAIACIGLRIAFGKGIWLPRKLLAKHIPLITFQKIMDKTLVVIEKIGPWIHPRLIGMCHSPYMEKTNGVIIFILGAFLALPLPIPLSNLTAAWSLLLVSLGMLEDDGIFILTGYLVSSLTVLFFLLMGITAKSILQTS